MDKITGLELECVESVFDYYAPEHKIPTSIILQVACGECMTPVECELTYEDIVKLLQHADEMGMGK